MPKIPAYKKEKLRQVLAEIEARGLEVPGELQMQIAGIQPPLRWDIDEDGYFRKNNGKRFNPEDYHEGFVNSRALFVGMIGGRGSGKSCSGAQRVMRKVKVGESGVIMNPDFENFKISTWAELREWIPWNNVVPRHKDRGNPDWFPNQPFIITFNNGATILCKGLKSAESARGPNVNFFWYDEGGRDETGDGFRIAVPSVRVGKNPEIIVTGTPNGDEHWMSKLFIYKEFPEEIDRAMQELASVKNRPLIETFHGSTFDNKNNLEPETFAFINAMYPSGWLRDQEIYGKAVKQGAGALGNRAWFDGKIVAAPPLHVRKRVRYWDLAATEKKAVGKTRYDDPDETVGTRLSWVKDKLNDIEEFYIEDQIAGRWEWRDIKNTILKTAQSDGPSVEIWIEREPGSGGINQVAEITDFLRDNLGGFYFVDGHSPRKETGDKVMRANVWFAEAAEGKFYMVYGEWNEPCLRQLSVFPHPAYHDDKIDSISGARHVIAPIRSWKTVPFLHL